MAGSSGFRWGQRFRATGAQILAVLGMLLLSACFPSRPIDPVAVRLSGNEFEVLYISCDPIELAKVELIKRKSGGHYISEDDVPIWQIMFDPPALVEDFIVGELPPNAAEDIPLKAELAPDVAYAVRLTMIADLRLYGTLEPGKLDNKMYYGTRYISPEEFEAQTACG